MLHVLKYNGMAIAKNIELARTVPGQMLGLMFRSSIPPDYAMVFIMKRPSFIILHMLFMRFPIDVILLDEEKRIIWLSRLNPWSGYKAMGNIKYIIETGAGTIERYSLGAGGQIEFEAG
ncbi:MAG: DUF192 domain-containing protein [Candidatus Methanoperedens sp.]|nr:DUF192 domain-containing protein [Candidatus Methanoperedens sp.]